MFQKDRTWIAYVLLGAMLVLTLAGALLLIPQDCWDARFFLSTGVLLVAEIQLVLVPVVLSRVGSAVTSPWHAGQVMVSVLYFIAAIVLAAIGLGDIGLRGLAVLHLLAFFLWLAGMGLAAMAATHTANGRARTVAGKQWFTIWRSRFDQICDQAFFCRAPEAVAVKTDLTKLQDELRYTDRESLPGSEAIETELNGHLDDLGRRVATLVTQTGDSEAITAQAQAVQDRLVALRAALRRRDELLRGLR